jgi:hypothetical protein
VRRDSIARAERLWREGLRTKTLYLGQNERVTGLTVSPTGNALIVTTTITTPGSRQTIVPNWVTLNGYTEDLTVRTKVGDVQNGGRAAFMSLPSGEIHWIKPIPRDSAEVPSITAVLGWNDAGTQALLFAERKDFKERYLHRIDANGGRLTTIDVLKDSAWVGGPCYPCGGYLPGSDKVWLVSEADGYAHLYTMNPDGSGKAAAHERQVGSRRRTHFERPEVLRDAHQRSLAVRAPLLSHAHRRGRRRAHNDNRWRSHRGGVAEWPAHRRRLLAIQSSARVVRGRVQAGHNVVPAHYVAKRGVAELQLAQARDRADPGIGRRAGTGAHLPAA